LHLDVKNPFDNKRFQEMGSKPSTYDQAQRDCSWSEKVCVSCHRTVSYSDTTDGRCSSCASSFFRCAKKCVHGHVHAHDYVENGSTYHCGGAPYSN
jgi:predicted amidophosphoribosyltransferase